jgi:hypothetical protein
VFGSRDWTDRLAIYRALLVFPAGTTLVHGGNGLTDPMTGSVRKGADRMAAEVGAALNFNVVAHPADWDRHGPAAGPMRNHQMLVEHHASEERVGFALALGFHDSIETSKGSRDMRERLVRAGVPHWIIKSGYDGAYRG